MPNLGLSFNLRSSGTITQAGVEAISDLSLWLKADVGVNTFSYNYISSITLSGAGESSINGNYTAQEPPQNGYNTYVLNGPNGNRIQVRPFYVPRYRLYNIDNYTYPNPRFNSFTSNDGSTWTAAGKKPVSITLSGLTGASSQSNGTYNSFEWNADNGSFTSNKSVGGGIDTNVVVEIYPNDGAAGAYILSPEFFISAEKTTGWGIGAWYLNEGTGSPVGTGTLYPSGGVPTGVVTTTNVVTPNVTIWSDQSPLGHNFIGVNSPILNPSSLNGRPTITLSSTEFNDDGDPYPIRRYFTSFPNAEIMGQTGTTAFAVVYVDDVCQNDLDNGAIFGNFGISADGSHYPYGPNCFVFDSFATENRKGPLTPPVQITNAWSLYSVTSTTNDWRAYVNGKLMYSDPENVYSPIINNNDGEVGFLYIGLQVQGDDYCLNGKVAEIMIYNRVLSNEERSRVETYLANKYAIQV